MRKRSSSLRNSTYFIFGLSRKYCPNTTLDFIRTFIKYIRRNKRFIESWFNFISFYRQLLDAGESSPWLVGNGSRAALDVGITRLRDREPLLSARRALSLHGVAASSPALPEPEPHLAQCLPGNPGFLQAHRSLLGSLRFQTGMCFLYIHIFYSFTIWRYSTQR